MARSDYLVVGGGIVGLATALAVLERQSSARVLLVEKEASWAAHQTGRNSGVIHSGIYYKPGSLKARLARQGNLSMVAFCRKHDLQHDLCGKVIVASLPDQLPVLENLRKRGLENGLEIQALDADQVRQFEPHVQAVAGLRVPSTGIVDYRAVCRKLSELVQDRGGELRLGTRVLGARERPDAMVVETTAGPFETRLLVNCAGLHSDRVARLSGAATEARIVPFRGEYYELRQDRRHLVRSLIYPVPNPAFPFLGVHFTRMIDGSVHAGPNAVLSFKREGYHKTDVSLRDLAEVLLFPGFWRLAARHAGEGMRELARSLSKRRFTRSLQELIPELRAEDLVPSAAGVRAQALLRSGSLVDDFLIVDGPRAVHVCNAPSPAATASLEIGKVLAERVVVRT
jgi:L-2-hydroxyglutarate oxidase